MKVTKINQIIAGMLMMFLIVGLLPIPTFAQQQDIKAADATYVHNGAGLTETFIKVGEKAWKYKGGNSNFTTLGERFMNCQETNKDEWSIYLTCESGSKWVPPANLKLDLKQKMIISESYGTTYSRAITTIRNTSVAENAKWVAEKQVLIDRLIAIEENKLKAKDLTSAKYNTNGSNYNFLKVADKRWKKWTQGSESNLEDCQQYQLDEYEVYLTCRDRVQRKDVKITLALRTMEIIILGDGGASSTRFPLLNPGKTPIETNAKSLAVPATITVTGKVTAPDGKPLAGVKVIEKADYPTTAQLASTTTDANGQYTINVADGNSKLTFTSSILNPEEVAIQSNKVIDKSLKCAPNTKWTGSICQVLGPISSDVYIVPKVEFHMEFDLTLAEAQRIAVDNGWVLATAEEVENAWKYSSLDHFAYGMLNDGRFAVPVQKDYPPMIKRGANIGITGGNQGFFYLAKGAVSRTQTAPPPAPKSNVITVNTSGGPLTYPNGGQIPDSILKDPAFEHLRFKFLCNSDPGNPMLNGWNNADRPLLEEAARDLFKKEGKQGWRDNINELLPQLRNDPERRWKFAPFMLRVMWNALVATNPTSAQEQFRKKFEKWAACDETKVAKMTLADWNNYNGKTRDIGGKFWFGERKPYTQNGLFIPRKRSTEGFLPLENPLYMGFKGRDEVQKLIRPLMAHQTPDVEDYERLRVLDDELALLAEKIGFGSAGSLAFVGLAGTPIVYDAAKTSITTALDTEVAKANNLADDIADLEKAYVQYGSKAKTSGSKVPIEAAKNAGKANKGTKGVIKVSKVFKDIGKHIWSKAANQAAKTGTATGAATGGKVAAQVTSKVGFRLILSVAVVGALLTVGDIAASIAEAIKAEKYEEALNRSANTVKPFSVSKTLGRNPDGLAKANLFMQLLKMTIADPADEGLLTLDYPTIECPPGKKNGTKTICVWEVKFHNQASLTMEQAQQIANANGWEIATAKEVEKAWYYLEYEKYAFGRTADGNFAVPVVKDYSNFKFGPNLNAVGGNQGFFYTVGKAKRSIRKEGLPKIP